MLRTTLCAFNGDPQMQVFEPISEKPMTDLPDSLGSMLLQSSQQFGSRIAMTIPRNKTREELTYSALFEQVLKVAQALWQLGVRRGDRVCLFSENCAEWAWVDWACQTLGVVLVPVYPTLPAEQAAFIAEDSGAVLFIAGSDAHFERVQGAVKARLIKLLGDGESVMGLASGDSPLTREQWLTEISLTQPSDLATIIYTSGTTGNPKGAMLENHSLVWLSRAIHASLPVDENDTFLSWLPLAHVYERFAGHILPISCGAKIAYAQSLATLANDMVSCSPTI
ncbi:MAG: AMP-binding protein, partial [Chthonomonas sp.]|nr:AMP-binding protein [Chthonomonas sp.]